jgi:hypothetical protein
VEATLLIAIAREGNGERNQSSDEVGRRCADKCDSARAESEPLDDCREEIVETWFIGQPKVDLLIWIPQVSQGDDSYRKQSGWHKA